jgi:hypothetical protein
VQQPFGEPLTRAGPGLLIAIAALFVAGASCGPRDVVRVERNGEDEVSIVDRTGKGWDISYGVNELGLDPERFQYGLGPFAITPIVEPEMLSVGDPGYPDRTSSARVIGIERSGDARAYPISVLRRHEIADDVIAGEALAVGY